MWAIKRLLESGIATESSVVRESSHAASTEPVGWWCWSGVEAVRRVEATGVLERHCYWELSTSMVVVSCRVMRRRRRARRDFDWSLGDALNLL